MGYVAISDLFEVSPREQAKGGAGKTKAQRVPVMVSHCVLAVTKKGYSVRAAWKICRGQMTKQGYLKPPYKERGGISTVRPTVRGVRRGMKHAMEPKAPSKFDKFSRLFRRIEAGIKD